MFRLIFVSFSPRIRLHRMIETSRFEVYSGLSYTLTSTSQSSIEPRVCQLVWKLGSLQPTHLSRQTETRVIFVCYFLFIHRAYFSLFFFFFFTHELYILIYSPLWSGSVVLHVLIFKINSTIQGPSGKQSCAAIFVYQFQFFFLSFISFLCSIVNINFLYNVI